MATRVLNDETTSNAVSSASTPLKGDTEEQVVQRYVKEMKNWTDDLKPYWTQMTRNEELYEFYKAEYNETNVNVALNTSFAIIESQIAKENQASLTVTVQAEGENNLAVFEEWVSNAIRQIMEDRRVAAIKGTFRKKKERFSRQLKVVGNACAEIAYCYQTQVENGKKKVIADNPYLINRHYKHIIFNPARQFDSSNVYYVVDHMRFEDMKAQEQQVIKGADGKEVTTGKFQNLDLLKKSLTKSKDTKLSEDQDIRFNSGDTKITKKNEPVEVVTRWELKPAGWTRCVFADKQVMVMKDQVDPYKIGGHNLLLAMRYVIEGRPYAYGELDPIYKMARAQDTIVNQKIEMVNKRLRGSYIAGSSIDVDSFMLVLQQGGVMNGIATDIASVPVADIPQAAFLETNELQQAMERAARYSPYDNGAAQSADDKTKGTKGGIIALQNASEPNVKTQIDDLEDMLLEPYAYKAIKMKAQYMAPDETFSALIEGKNSEWVKISKGIMAGTASLQDFITMGLIQPQDAQQLVGTTMNNGTSIESVTSPLFDTSWLLDISLDVESAQEKADQLTQEQALLEFAVEKLGVQVDPDRTFEYLAEKKDALEMRQLLLSPQEKQQRQQQQQQAEQQRIQGEIAIKQAGKADPAPPKPEKVSIMTDYKDAPSDVQRQIEALDGLTPSQIQPQVAATMKQPLPDHMLDVPPPPPGRAIANGV